MSIALGRTHFVTVQGLWHLTCRFLSPASKPPIANVHDCNTSQMLECFRKRIKYHIYNLLHRIKNRFDDLQNEIRKKKKKERMFRISPVALESGGCVVQVRGKKFTCQQFHAAQPQCPNMLWLRQLEPLSVHAF